MVDPKEAWECWAIPDFTMIFKRIVLKCFPAQNLTLLQGQGRLIEGFPHMINF
jgi:hypothetical protein